MPGNVEIIIGEFFPQPASGNRVFASVYAAQKVQCKIEIQNEGQRVCFSRSVELEKEGDAIELDIQGFPPGNYSVLINIGDEVWERGLLAE